jgi:DNA-binding NarL/FixJ family response regulator
MSGEIRVLIVDDDYYMRQALLALLWKESGMKVVGVASCPEELIYLVSTGDIQKEADVVLLGMKYIGDEMTGINAIEEIHGEVPGAKVVILSMLSQTSLILEAVHAGADGYLWKLEVAGRVADAVRKVHHGHFVVTQSLGNIPFDEPVTIVN